MIHSFTFKNFCSFAEEATIDFEVSRKGVETRSNMFCDSSTGTCLSKVTTVIGPNASGKTSALKALSFLGWFVRNSFAGLEGEKESIPIDTFSFSKTQKGIAEFEIVYEHDFGIYKYILHLCKTHVLKEELYTKDKKTNHFNYLFKRLWNSTTDESDIVQRINLRAEVIKEILRRNVSLISAGIAIKNETITKISSFWQGIISNVNRVGKTWDTASLGEQGLFQATEEYRKNKELFEKATQFLRDVDLGLSNIAIQEGNAQNVETGEVRKVHRALGVHIINGKEYHLPFAFESSGTKNMFVLLHFLLPAIEQGGVAVIDELEIDLHPHTLPCIIELFANPESNPKNTQLLFTSYSFEILNHLEKEQIVLVEKNKDCKSELFRLNDLKGVRRDDNIYAKYMAGAYGAVPNI